MKICGISDIHGNFIDIPNCEVLCICGDIVGLNDQRNIEASRYWWYNRFVQWVNEQPCEKIIITPGNHDFFIEHAFKNGWLNELKQDLSVRTNEKLVLLIDEEYIYKDTKFYGTPWINPISFQQGKWAFELNYSTQYENIPNDTDVLISHDSPYQNKYLDFYSKSAKYHLFGHWHDGKDDKINGRYNCSILNDWYNHKKDNKIQTIDTTMDVLETKKINFALIEKLIDVAECNKINSDDIDYIEKMDNVLEFLYPYAEIYIPIEEEDKEKIEIEVDVNKIEEEEIV
jgi:hypothetical protein